MNNGPDVSQPNPHYARNEVKTLEDPPFARALFGDVRWAWIWLLVRLFVGWEWVTAGWGKVTSPAWTGADAGTALAGFVNGALAKTGEANPAVEGWYAWFLQHIVLPFPVAWGYLVAWGELLVGASSTNPILLAGAGLENGRLVGGGSLAAACAGHNVEPGSYFHA